MKFTLYVFALLVCVIWLSIAIGGAVSNFILSQTYPRPIFWGVNTCVLFLLSRAFSGMLKTLHK